MRVLLLGAGGMLAHDLIAEAPSGVELITRNSQQLDVTIEATVRAELAKVRPDIVLNAAAYTHVDKAESERERAFAVNGEAPAIIGQATATVAPSTAHGARRTPLVVHFSTDYVFDGTLLEPYREDDPTAPLGVYGASKLAGERALAESGAQYLIIRTQWLFGVRGRSFPRTMWQRAKARQVTRVVNDQVGRPTYTVDLARAIWLLLGTGGAGPVIHIANRGTATWYDVAMRIFAAAGVPELVRPCTSDEYPTPARRPARSVLVTAKFERLKGDALPSWQDAIDRFLGQLAGEG